MIYRKTSTQKNIISQEEQKQLLKRCVETLLYPWDSSSYPSRAQAPQGHTQKVRYLVRKILEFHGNAVMKNFSILQFYNFAIVGCMVNIYFLLLFLRIP